ncbi:MAG: hypothetical protein D6796_02410 [Caldilineae bacterium]|nr:MAG: hypothetical protein D6796_02410 [Caldilineae bacterium]
MQAIITAGGTLKADDPLFAETGIALKALLPIGGKPMIRWVADALIGSKYVERLVIVGLKPGDFDDSGLPVDYVASRGNIVDNVLAGWEQVERTEPDATKVLLCSSDIPLITPQIVDEFVETCLADDADVHYTIVEKQTMEARFPHSNRTFTRMKGGSYAGGDILLVDRKAVKANLELIRGLTGQRKNFLAQARMIGFVFIFRFLFRLMDVKEAEWRAGKALNLNGRVLDYPRAEVAMDVDKLHQYHLVKRELEAQVA